MVLVACSFIDGQLAAALRAKLLDVPTVEKLLEGFNAPLGTFSARIAISRALGVISAVEHAECERLRKVRNEFAHRVHCSFDDEKIEAICRELAFSAKPYVKADGEAVHVSSRGALSTAATALMLRLTNRAHYASKHRIADREWEY